jgi:hypothetical protein
MNVGPTVRTRQLRLAVIGLTGSGKSTVAGMVEAIAAERGLRCERLKLAAPLYRLQEVVYRAAGEDVRPQAQDQQLMEVLADALRRINPTSIVADFLSRLDGVDTDIVINDDLRDPDVDAPALVASGFKVVRVRTSEQLRAHRLAGRGDITVSDRSTVRLDAIRPDAVVENLSDLGTLRAAVESAMGGWL